MTHLDHRSQVGKLLVRCGDKDEMDKILIKIGGFWSREILAGVGRGSRGVGEWIGLFKLVTPATL